MMLESDEQLANTQRKLSLLNEQIGRAQRRPDTPENRQSLRSLTEMAAQLRDEIDRYLVQRKQRRAS